MCKTPLANAHGGQELTHVRLICNGTYCAVQHAGPWPVFSQPEAPGLRATPEHEVAHLSIRHHHETTRLALRTFTTLVTAPTQAQYW